ncbi:MAG: hypothetical protein WCY77_06775 [Weeksellaceae bacterium]
MSSFQVSSEMYLLECQEFYAFATFGNVDLEIFSKYNFTNDHFLTLDTNNDLHENLYVYGFNNESQTKNLLLTYQRLYHENAKKLFVMGDGKKSISPFLMEMIPLH